MIRVAALCLLLAGCASVPPRVVYKEVRTPIPVSCLKHGDVPPTAPRETDKLDLSTASLAEIVQAVLIDREAAKISDLNLRSALAGCAG
jgi:hypothetical protein